MSLLSNLVEKRIKEKTEYFDNLKEIIGEAPAKAREELFKEAEQSLKKLKANWANRVSYKDTLFIEIEQCLDYLLQIMIVKSSKLQLSCVMLTATFKSQKRKNYHIEDLWNAIVVKDQLTAIEIIKSLKV